MTEEMNTQQAGDTAPVNEAPASETVAPAATDTIQEFAVPEEYKDKGWATKVNSIDDVYKQLDAQDALIGKKTIGVPDFETATPDEISQYYEKTRPDDKNAYTFEEGTTEGDVEGFSNLFYENGISKHQGDAIIKSYQEQLAAGKADMFSEEGHNKALEAELGSNFNEVKTNNDAIAKKVFSEDVQKFVDELPNALNAKFHKAMGQFVKSYGATEGDANVNNSPSGVGKVDIKAEQSQIRQDLHKLSTRSHTAEEKAALLSRLNETYKG